MTVVVETRNDFNLSSYRRVAWDGEPVRISDAAVRLMRERRSQFLALLDNEPDTVVYGVTSGYGQMAGQRFDAEQQRTHAARPPSAAAASFGGALPARVIRGIVFARLVNYVEGHAAISPELALGVSTMLDGRRLPDVPAYGAASAGEILGLAHLFAPLCEQFALEEKDSLCLVNGAPCAAALGADMTLAAATRQALATRVFALSAEAIQAPLDAYDEALEDLWGDPFESEALAAIRRLLGGGAVPRRPYQAPVSFRALPRILGQCARACAQLGDAATTALKAVTDNPVYIDPAKSPPHGRVLSNGGYHNAAVPPALDNVAAAFADLTLICDRQVNRLLDGRVSRLPDFLVSGGGGYIGCLGFVSADYAEQARHAAQRTFIPGSDGGGFGQNDVAVPTFAAWRKAVEAGRCLDAGLAILTAVASQALYVSGRGAPPALSDFLQEIRGLFPPIEAPRAPGPDAGALAEYFTRSIYPEGG